MRGASSLGADEGRRHGPLLDSQADLGVGCKRAGIISGRVLGQGRPWRLCATMSPDCNRDKETHDECIGKSAQKGQRKKADT